MMSYLNPLLAFGYDALAERALAAGVCGFIVPGPAVRGMRRSCATRWRQKGLGLIQLVTPATPDERLKTLCAASRGFVYAVTITGITGGGTGLPADLAGLSRQGRRHSSICRSAPASAFARPQDVAAVGSHAAGAIVGSALVEVLERGEDPQAFLRIAAP